MKIDERLKRAVRENAEKLSSSNFFVVLFNVSMIEEVIPLVQMGLAIYMNKPIYLLLPESEVARMPENLRRLARGMEIYDDSLPLPLRISALEAATTRLIQAAMNDDVPKKQS